MKLFVRHQVLLILAAGLVFFVSLGGSALFNDEEAKNAACTAEMFRASAWVVPTYNGTLRTDAPILVNWIMLAAFRFLGVSEFSARLPSTLMAVSTILLTYHLGRKLYSSDIGFLAGIILCTCLQFSAVGRAATCDATLVFLVTGAMTSYVWIVTRQRGANFCRSLAPIKEAPETKPETEIKAESASQDARPRAIAWILQLGSSIRAAVLIYVPLALGVLTYGPLALILPCLVLLLFLVISQRLDDFESGKRLPTAGPSWRAWITVPIQLLHPRPIIAACREIKLLTGLTIVAAITLPWYLAVNKQTHGVWLKEFLTVEHFGPLFAVKNGHNGFPFLILYPVLMIHLGGFPWSVFLPVAIARLWDRLVDGAPWRESDRLLSCWIGVWLVVFSLSSTKLPDSLLPIYPAVALIMARYFNDWKRATDSSGVYSFLICCRALWICGCIMVLGLASAAYLYFPEEQWIATFGLVPVVGALIAAKFVDHNKRLPALRTLETTALLFAILCVVVIPLRLRPYQDSAIFVAEARQKAKSSEIVIGTYDYFEPSIVFYAGQNVRVLDSPRRVVDFLSSHPHAFVITRQKKYNELRNELSSSTIELTRHRNFLSGRELILIGRF